MYFSTVALVADRDESLQKLFRRKFESSRAPEVFNKIVSTHPAEGD